ncbi:thioredoxin family protein [Ideonella sp. DXS29W]|uniref:Thioredoxin family protein n=1 Tax=Ideonella lacteola TaxID=2984193 RepID=A0ABU9BTA0_9BURK
MAFTTHFTNPEPPRADVDGWQGTAVIEFGTPWCGFCLRAQPLIASAFERHPNLHHVKVEDGPGRPLGRSFRVKLWPTLILLRDGQEVERLVRPASAEELAEALHRLVQPSAAQPPIAPK